MKTLEQLGFIEELNGDRVYFSRQKYFGIYREWIEFNLSYKEIDIININTIDMMLLNAIHTKAKELFDK